MIPTLSTPDSSLAFVADGYGYISRTCDRLGSDAFRTRILGMPVTMMRGGDAARVFYEGGRFNRHLSMPPSVSHLLQDLGSVQTLEDDSHRHRKAGFLELLFDGGDARLGELFEEELGAAVERWRGGPPVVLHDELGPLLARAVFRWAGIPTLAPAEFRARAGELSAMVERAGSFGPLNWLARARRHRTERWAAGLVVAIRDGRVVPRAGSPLDAIARWTGDDGLPLSEDVAAVELLNLLRPTVAVVRFVEFAALALASRPAARSRLAAGDEEALAGFANEVRRRTPFFPVIAGRVRRPFRWSDHDFAPGDWVMLDIYGTNHDARLWAQPQRFRPERYATEDARHIVAQGSGDYLDDHRCPGEPATNQLIAAALRVLARTPWRLEPGQDLGVTYSRMPAKVRSGLRIRFAG
ncbi:cytochrome P450 [Naasia aerilata]|uniref:Cytochrome P450 n=1 Tax=Naasia aerilata TaxID=1162966 RepID=A0ABM8GDE9_9MICO|nr:cytochrome P450 [Naasia aerilata]BDZ46315.1 cytochrome P450 [Naasia aerilata]